VTGTDPVTDNDPTWINMQAQVTGPSFSFSGVTYTAPGPGTFRVGLFNERDGGDDYVFTDFEPFDARRAFPCFDEPAWKVPVRFTLEVPAAHVAASNAPIAEEKPLEGGLKQVVFKETPPLPTYLWAIAVGPFGVVDAGVAGQRLTAGDRNAAVVFAQPLRLQLPAERLLQPCRREVRMVVLERRARLADAAVVDEREGILHDCMPSPLFRICALLAVEINMSSHPRKHA